MVRGAHDRDPAGSGQVHEELVNAEPALGVEPGVRLVHDHDARPPRQGLGEQCPLTLSPGEFSEGAVRQTGQSHHVDHLGDRAPRVLRAASSWSSLSSSTPRPHGDGLADGERQRLRRGGTLHHQRHLAPAFHPTQAGGADPGQEFDERRLAGSVRPGDRGEGAVLHLEVDIVEHFPPRVAEAQSTGSYRGR